MDSPFVLIAKLEEEIKGKEKVVVEAEHLKYLLKCAKAHLMQQVMQCR